MEDPAQSNDPVVSVCWHCGRPIDPLRLKVIPQTVFCTACAAIAEGAQLRIVPPKITFERLEVHRRLM